MFTLVNKFISLDSFGEAVTVNFKGERTYKTSIGALCTISLKSFILAFSIMSIIDLMQYRDPQITQVRADYILKGL